jgi:recombination protein RecR
MEKYPDAINDLISAFKSFPGVGKRSAERMAFAILKWPIDKQKALGKLLTDLDDNISSCPDCGNISATDMKCIFCTDLSRKHNVICVVEEVTQIRSIEASGLFRGLYHVLGGRLAPLEGKGADDLNLSALLKRVKEDQVNEVILALGQDVEGQATSIYISDLLKGLDIKITRLARGLPAGSDIAYADAATIAAALNGRTSLD